MNNFEIFADSSANIPDSLVKKHRINIVPYSCTVNGEERLCYEKDMAFIDTAKKYYADMRGGADVKTSLVGEQRIIDAVKPCMQAGSDVVFVTISSGISGTYAQALKAKETLEKQFNGCKMYVCDSANASMGQGLQVLKLADLRDMGESAETCAKWVEQNAYKINSFVTVEDLKYLRKGGRVSTVAAIAGTILNIKPLLWANGTTPARLTMFGKVRGRKKAINALADAFRETAENIGSTPVAIAHGDCEEEALALAEILKDEGVNDVIVEYYDLCTGSHVGPGTIALFFYGKDRRRSAAEAQKKTAMKTAAQKI